jgi:hypothetical protein
MSAYRLICRSADEIWAGDQFENRQDWVMAENQAAMPGLNFLHPLHLLSAYSISRVFGILRLSPE